MKSEKLKVTRTRGGNTIHFSLFTLHFPLCCVFALILVFPAAAQTVAILTPDATEPSVDFAEKIAAGLDENVKVLDASLSETAYSSASPAAPFNMTVEESKIIGAAIGCDFFILIRSATQRRSAFRRAEYYESWAALYVVSSRTGRLVLWTLPRFEAARPDMAAKMLVASTETNASAIVEAIHSATKRELAEPKSPSIEEVPDKTSAAAKNFRSPIPYRRIKPEYTAEAALYGVAATIDLLVDLGADGSILRTEIVRWAGFGLDESVEKTVRAMNWRPAMRNGKPLPMRFLLRYNFRKIEKE